MERCSPGQRRIFPVLDTILQDAAQKGIIRAESGLFIIRGMYPFTDGAEIGQPWPPPQRRARVTEDELKAFIDGDTLEIIWKAAKW